MRPSQETEIRNTWYIRAADRLYSNSVLAPVASQVLDQWKLEFQISHYQWLFDAPEQEILNYAVQHPVVVINPVIRIEPCPGDFVEEPVFVEAGEFWQFFDGRFGE